MSFWEEFINKIAGIRDGYIVLSLTDEYMVESWTERTKNNMLLQLNEKMKYILEVRVFNELQEIKCFRTDISKEFRIREIIEAEWSEWDSFDEEQLLDIDRKASIELFAEKHMVQSIGGGQYGYPLVELPMEEQHVIVRIRYYLDKYEATGQARVKDWRLVGFEVVDIYGKE